MYELKLTLKESLIGFEKKIPHMDGTTITITKKGLSLNKTGLLVEKKGYTIPDLAHPHKVGDKKNLYIEFAVEEEQLPPLVYDFVSEHM
jgi:hypothetical protein